VFVVAQQMLTKSICHHFIHVYADSFQSFTLSPGTIFAYCIKEIG